MLAFTCTVMAGKLAFGAKGPGVVQLSVVVVEAEQSHPVPLGVPTIVMPVGITSVTVKGPMAGSIPTLVTTSVNVPFGRKVPEAVFSICRSGTGNGVLVGELVAVVVAVGVCVPVIVGVCVCVGESVGDVVAEIVGDAVFVGVWVGVPVLVGVCVGVTVEVGVGVVQPATAEQSTPSLKDGNAQPLAQAVKFP
jgi:hypothetical protein